MNILSVCEYLKNKLNVDIKGDYYGSISQWEDWYKGYYKPFHHYTDYNGRETVQLDRYSLKMAKKVCEDWANMLLNEETMVVLENKEAQKFVDGVFERNDFFADNRNYAKIVELDIELYTNEKDFASEERIEAALETAGLTYGKEETTIDSERLYEVIYTCEVYING